MTTHMQDRTFATFVVDYYANVGYEKVGMEMERMFKVVASTPMTMKIMPLVVVMWMMRTIMVMMMMMIMMLMIIIDDENGDDDDYDDHDDDNDDDDDDDNALHTSSSLESRQSSSPSHFHLASIHREPSAQRNWVALQTPAGDTECKVRLIRGGGYWY